MPRGDGTGPLGQGPRTGRAAGYCAGYDVPGFMNPVSGRGFWGRGFRGGGGGRGYRWFWRTGYYGYPGPAVPPVPPVAPYPGTPYQADPKEEIKYLEGVAETVKKELEAIQKRIDELSQKE
jgi:hypothetical protein